MRMEESAIPFFEVAREVGLVEFSDFGRRVGHAIFLCAGLTVRVGIHDCVADGAAGVVSLNGHSRGERERGRGPRAAGVDDVDQLTPPAL